MKRTIEDLALFGGQPVFRETLHVGRPNIPNRQKLLERVNRILDKRWLTNRGEYVQALERKLEDFLGVKHCVCMCNGTIALEIVVRALGLTGEVIIPSFTFVATAHALQWQEITPVFCDVDPVTHALDPQRIKRLVTPRTTGIIGVHLWGRPCDIDGLQNISKEFGLQLLFDAAHAFGCSYKGKMIGGFGSAEVFSFHATKFINTLEGGAVATNDDDLAKKMRLMKNFGFAGLDNVVYIGTNGKMDEISAATGLTSLETFDEFVEVNWRNYLTYAKFLSGVRGIRLLKYDRGEKGNYQYVIVEVDESETGIHRDHLMRVLHAENVRARRYFYPGCHRMEPYRSFFPNAGLLLPETERLVERVLCLPTGTCVNEDDIHKICEIVIFVVERSRLIRERLT